MFLAGKLIKPAAAVAAAWGAGTTWSSSDRSGYVTLSNGNLTAYGSNTGSVRATTSKSSGRAAFEVLIHSFGSANTCIGLGLSSAELGNYPGYAGGIGWHQSNQVVYNGGSLGYVTALTTGSRVGVVLDRDASTVAFYKNGVLAGTFSCSALSGALFPMVYPGVGGSLTANFGATAFAYSYP